MKSPSFFFFALCEVGRPSLSTHATKAEDACCIWAIVICVMFFRAPAGFDALQLLSISLFLVLTPTHTLSHSVCLSLRIPCICLSLSLSLTLLLCHFLWLSRRFILEPPFCLGSWMPFTHLCILSSVFQDVFSAAEVAVDRDRGSRRGQCGELHRYQPRTQHQDRTQHPGILHCSIRRRGQEVRVFQVSGAVSVLPFGDNRYLLPFCLFRCFSMPSPLPHLPPPPLPLSISCNCLSLSLPALPHGLKSLPKYHASSERKQWRKSAACVSVHHRPVSCQ